MPSVMSHDDFARLHADLKRIISAALVANNPSWHPDDATALAILLIVDRCSKAAESAGAEPAVIAAIRALARHAPSQDNPQ